MGKGDKYDAGNAPWGVFQREFEMAEEMPYPAEEAEEATDRTYLEARQLRALLGPAFERMRNRRDGKEVPVPLPEKWANTRAELHGGLWAGCWILVGGTGVGKSQWAFVVAYHAAVQARVPVAYVGLELDATGLVARLAALGLHEQKPATDRGARIKVPWSGLYHGDQAALAWFESNVIGAEVLAEMNAAPFYLVTGEARNRSVGWNYRNIGTLAEELRQKHPDGPALLVVDFLQLVGNDPNNQRHEELRERIGNAAYEGRMAARKHGISVLLVSATARTNYALFAGEGAKLGAGDPARFLGTGKESGEVEYAADGVLALCREQWPKGAPPPPVYLAVAKARAGLGPNHGWVSYSFDGTTFEEQVREINL
jgi:replicative DNA helicase